MLIYEEKLNHTHKKENKNDILFLTIRKRPAVKDPFGQEVKGTDNT